MRREEKRLYPIFNKKINKRYKKILMQRLYLTIGLCIAVIITYILSVSMQPEYLSYKEQSDLDYHVYLKENNYYERASLEKDMQYIASLIDYIDVDFNYRFDMSKNMDYEYKYYIEADVRVFEKAKPNNIIFQKKEKLLEDIIKNEENSNGFRIDENIKIDYVKYNNLIKGFKTEYSLAADSNLKLTLYIEINDKQNETENLLRTSNNMEITIPLTEQTVSFNMNYKEINNSNKIESSNKLVINNILRNVSFTLAGVFVLMIVNVVRFIFKVDEEKTYYQRRVDKILRDYDRVVVKLKKAIHISEDDEIIEVVSFEELLGISDRLCKSILFMETEKQEEGWFIIKNGREIYRYMIQENSLTVDKKATVSV